ncbi:MAG: hypothetical protein WBB24_02840 [Maribacter sp.]
METDKFEQHIKSKLQEREIEPSANAWERISGELKAPASEPKKSNYVWMSIAASVVVLIAISMFYFISADEEIGNDTIVVEENTNPINEKLELEDLNLSEVETMETADVVQDKLEDEFQSENRGLIVVESKNIIKGQLSDTVLDAKTRVGNTALMAKVEETLINAKVAEILAKVTIMEKSSTVTDAEVDSLLQQAQQDILKQKLFRTDASVDAMALLTEVEDELDQSFRDQIFNSLKAGFIKVRTAVADRNN